MPNHNKPSGRVIPKQDAAEAFQDVLARAFQMFSFYHWKTRIHGDSRADTDPAFVVLKNAALESSLMSIRDLDDFFSSSPHCRRDDIIAQDFGFAPQLGFLTAPERDGISKKLAHLTYRAVHERRQQPAGSNPRTWNFADLVARAVEVLLEFLVFLESGFFKESPAEQSILQSAKRSIDLTLQNINALARAEFDFTD